MNYSTGHVRSKTKRTRHGQAAEVIGRRIVTGEWAVGMPLPTEAELSRELDVSRASLREAIKILAGKGLLTSRPRRGTIVEPQTCWNRLDVDVLIWETTPGVRKNFLKDLFELRRMIEPAAAALAAERAGPAGRMAIASALKALETAQDMQQSIEADLAFHREIINASGNSLLAAFSPAIEASLKVSFTVSRSGHAEAHTVPLHKAVAYPVLAGDAEGARTAMQLLLDRSERDAAGIGIDDESAT